MGGTGARAVSGCPRRSYKVWEQQGEIRRCEMVERKKGGRGEGANLRVFFSVVLVTVFKGAISLSFGWGGEVSGQKEFGIS